MTREEVFSACQTALTKSNVLLLEAATGLGKSKQAIDLVNWISDSKYKNHRPKMLLLVAKRVHKETWKEEFKKWGGIKSDVIIECYESLHKHTNEYFDFVIGDEIHHIQSEARMEMFNTIKYGYIIGLSATIPFKVKQYFKFRYHSQIVSCDILEAIEDDILPEPKILLYPLELDNHFSTETIEINPKAKGRIEYDTYKNLWKYKRSKVHAIISCTPKQKIIDMNTRILWEKNQFTRTRNEALKNRWLHDCGVRLEYLSNLKNPIVINILEHLKKFRTITFCKTIEQCELLGKNCIHSQNKNADGIYNKFNQKKINHITAVNILNENANLVDCKYAIFSNLSSSEVVIPQRLGRAMRHKSPVIIVPFYKSTREEEIVTKMFADYNKEFIRIIKSIEEI